MTRFQTKILFVILFLTFFVNVLKCSAETVSNVIKNKQDYTLLLSTDFADGTVNPWGVQANSGDISVVTSPTDSSKKVMKAHINVNEDFSHVANGTPRSELVDHKIVINNDSEYLIKFSTYLPSDFQMENLYSNPHIFFQVLQNVILGSPPLSIGIDKDNYRMASCTGDGHSKRPAVVKPLGKVTDDLGKWVDWMVFYRPSYSENGKIIIWKNKQVVINYTGFCAYKDVTSYIKTGIYKWDWKKAPTTTTDIIMYFSNINIYKWNS